MLSKGQTYFRTCMSLGATRHHFDRKMLERIGESDVSTDIMHATSCITRQERERAIMTRMFKTPRLSLKPHNVTNLHCESTTWDRKWQIQTCKTIEHAVKLTSKPTDNPACLHHQLQRIQVCSQLCLLCLPRLRWPRCVIRSGCGVLVCHQI